MSRLSYLQNKMSRTDESSKSKGKPQPKQQRRIEPRPGSNLTVLSIDGFGVHSFISLKILDELEKHLQEQDGKAARITDYFDVISSTGTGAIIAAMLTAQSENHRLPPTVSQITEFMKDLFGEIDEAMSKNRSHSEAEQSQADNPPSDSEARQRKGWFACIMKILRFFLVTHKKEVDRTIINEIEDWFKDAKLSTTSSKLVIPVHDLDSGRPFLLSSKLAEKLEDDHYAEIKLSDVVLASLSTLFTAQNYQEIHIGGKRRNFLEGGYATTNPTLLAVQEAEMYYKRDDCKDFLVLSLGTAERRAPDDIWSTWSWFLAVFWKKKSLLHWIIEVQQYVYSMLNEIVEIYMSQLFYSKETKRVADNYLRVKDFDLDEEETMPAMVDVKEIKKLEKIGKRILQKEVVQVNPVTGTPEKLTQVLAQSEAAPEKLTQVLAQSKAARKKRNSQVLEQSEKKFTANQASLEAFAKKLVDERNARLPISSRIYFILRSVINSAKK